MKGGEIMPQKKKENNPKKQKLNTTAVVVAIIKFVQEIVKAWIENR